jgi:lysophospholipid acyltransferase (LPLAT)-like uncharacterized protein
MEDKIALDSVSRAFLLAGSILGKTWRFSLTGTTKINPFRDTNKGIIYCFWHSHILALSYIFRGIGVKAVVSNSRDGERATAIAQRWGHGTIRGSSSLHGMAVIRQCVRELRKRQNIVIVPDGPRGPREIVKPGVAQIASLAGAGVFAVSALPKSAWRLNSWDGFMVPRPFTSIEIRISGPIDAARFSGSADPLAEFTASIQRALTL